jgi:ketosteroid isomerase-like protein
MDRPTFQRWLDDYLEAWRSNDPQRIGNLFSEDAVYHRTAYSRPIEGRAEIVRFWTTEPDAPGSWEAQYEPLVVEGDSGVASGRTRYFVEPGGPQVADEYANVFLVRFDEDGRCREFREWWMQRPKVG